MFSSSSLWMMLFGILLGIALIVSSVIFVKDVLVRFVIMVFTALVALFIVDKVIAFKIKLIPDEMNNQLFDLIKTLVLMIFSYYFGTKNNSKEDE
jgi:hypothetical protein